MAVKDFENDKNAMNMKKKIAATAILALALISFSSPAQTPQVCPTDPDSQPVCMAPTYRGGKACNDPFAGLTLTEAQKSQLDELNKKQAEQRRKNVKAVREQRGRRNAEMSKFHQEQRRQYLADVKAIVGPEQYVVFLENFYVNAVSDRRATFQRHHSKMNADGGKRAGADAVDRQ